MTCIYLIEPYFFIPWPLHVHKLSAFPDVYSGFLNSNHVKEVDCGVQPFLNGLGELAEGVGTIRFHLPYRNLTKADVVKQAVKLARTHRSNLFRVRRRAAFLVGHAPTV